MSDKRKQSDSSGFEDLAEELDRWDETFDSLHESEDELLVKARQVAETGPPVEPAASADEVYPSIEQPAFQADEVEISIVAPARSAVEVEPEPLSPFSLADDEVDADFELDPPDPFGAVGEFDPVALGSLFEPASEAPRRGPAIVRRDDLERKRLFESTGEDDDDAVIEWDRPSITNVMAQATVDKMVETAAAFFADDDEPEVEIEVDGDFYDDIEIDEREADHGEAAPFIELPAAPSGEVSRRTMAHVVRRVAAPTSPPPLQAVDTAVKLEIASLQLGERIAPDAALEAAHRAINELTFDQDSGLLPIEQRPLSDLGTGEIDAGDLVIATEDDDDANVSADANANTNPAFARAGSRPFVPAPRADRWEPQASPLESLGFDLPPQLPTPLLAFASGTALASLVLELPELGEALPLGAGASDDELEDVLAAIELLPSGHEQAAFHRWAATISLDRGDLDAAKSHLLAAAKGDPSGDEAERTRQLTGREGAWEDLSERYAELEPDAFAVLTGELAIALGQVAELELIEGDVGSLLRAATAHARAGDVAALAERAHALAEVVADDDLRRALLALTMRIRGPGDELPVSLSDDIVAWETSATLAAPARAGAALVLADAFEKRGDPDLADGFRYVASGLAIAAGDIPGAKVALIAAAQRDASHPAVCRPLLTLLSDHDAEISDYLIAVASGSAAAPLAARALWRWSRKATGASAEEMLRRAHALAPDDAMILASLERVRALASGESSEAGEGDAVAEVGLALAPVLGGGLVDSLNRARAAHLAGQPEGREKALAGVELPTERLLVVGERLAHIGRGAEIGASPTGIAHEVLWRHRALSDLGTAPTGAIAAEMTTAAEAGDRLSARARLIGIDPLEAAASDTLWDASSQWGDLCGRVELAQARLLASIEPAIDGEGAGREEGGNLAPTVILSAEGATAAFAVVEEWNDPRVRWLASASAARMGDWQRAADRAMGLAQGSYRGAYLLLERVGDAAAAEKVLAGLLEEHPEREYLAELCTAARRQLGVLAPEVSRRAAARPVTASLSEPFASAIRLAEASEINGDWAASVGNYRRAIELHPGDPIAVLGLSWACARKKDAAPIAEITLAELRRAEDAADPGGRADAYEALARIDDEIAGDLESALIAWESAADCVPTRRHALRALELAQLAGGRHRDLLVLYGRLLALVESPVDEASLRGERARVADLCGRDRAEVVADYATIAELDPSARMALFFASESTRLGGASSERANFAERAAVVLGADSRSASAFLCRCGETLAELGRYEEAIEKYRAATTATPGHLPSLKAWREAAWRSEQWLDFATACELASEVAISDDERASLLHLAGLALMDRALDGARAISVLERARATTGAAQAASDDAFARLRLLFEEIGDDERHGDLLRARLESETEPAVVLALRLELANLSRNFWNDREGAIAHLRAALEIEPQHKSAVADLSDISWELGAWDVAAESLLARAKLETSPSALKHIFYRLGTIYSDHLPDPSWAIRCFRSVLANDPDDVQALERLAALSQQTGDLTTALAVCERLLKLDLPNNEKVAHLHRVADIQRQRGQLAAAERAVRVAFDLAPGSRAALGVLLGFYREAGDVRSIRVNLDRAAQVMRSRFAADGNDTEALAVIARVLAVRERSGVSGSMAVAKSTAEIARFLGDVSAEVVEIAESGTGARPRLEALARPEPDELLTPAAIPAALRHILRALRGRIGKYVGADPKRFGVGRGERQKRGKHPVANLAAEMAAELGLRGADIYVSSAALGAAIAVPTEPLSLVLGSRFASLDRAAELTFALGRGLKLGQMGLALVDSMTPEDLDVFVAGLIRQFVPDYPGFGQTPATLANEQQRLRRMIPGSLLSELGAHAVALAGARLRPGSLHEAMRKVGLRAGLLASTNAAGALAAALRLGGHSSIQEASEDPDILDFCRFALSEDHVRLRALMAEERSQSS